MNIPFKIFPVGPYKAPLISGWQEKATRDAQTIAEWEAQGATAWGIPCGTDNGLFVIDLDVEKDSGAPVGEESLKAMPRLARLLDHANVRTPSGGRHIYFRHFDGGRNTTSKVGPKIDTRGQGGYVIAPGSKTEGGLYEGFYPEVLPPVPPGLRARLVHMPIAQVPAQARQTPAGEVEDLLAYIPADLPYNDWLAVLMALHHRFSGSDEGLAIADRWSATGAKYRQGEVATKWHSFKRTGVTWRTVPALARENGADLSEIARRWG